MKREAQILQFLGLTICFSLIINCNAFAIGVASSKIFVNANKIFPCKTFSQGYTKIENSLRGSDALYAKTNSSNIRVYLSTTYASCPDRILVYAEGVGSASLSIYRIGYYRGLGARLIAIKSLPNSLTNKSADIVTSHSGADGSASLTITANFPQVATLNIDNNWVPGMYAIKISTKKYAGISYLAVGNYAGSEKAIMVSATNTFQAYNRYGGHSTYYKESYVIDYNRPLSLNANANFKKSESRILYLLEENGIDTAVTTDEAFRDSSNVFRNHKIVILPTHSEYWSQGEMDQVTRASTNHLAILNFGANEGWWRIRFDPNRQFSSYKLATRDPIKGGLATVDFFEAGRTTTPLFGTSYGCVRAKGIPIAQLNNWLVIGTTWNRSASLRGEISFNLPAIFLSQNSEIDVTKIDAPPDTQYLARGELTQCQGGTSKYGPVTLWAISYRPSSPDHGMTFNAGTEGWGFALNEYDSLNPTLKADSQNVEIMTMAAINLALFVTK